MIASGVHPIIKLVGCTRIVREAEQKVPTERRDTPARPFRVRHASHDALCGRARLPDQQIVRGEVGVPLAQRVQ
jgi:hypothetical protein